MKKRISATVDGKTIEIIKRILKKDIKESYDTLDRLGKILPEIKQDKFKPVKIHKTSKKRRDLEFEIEEIKRKISELH